MAENPLKSMMPKDKEGEGLGKELREKMEMQKAAGDSLKGGATSVGPAPTKTLMSTSPQDKTNTQGPYGTGAGEKRIDVSNMTKPLGQMHKGGTIQKTGQYVMKAGEKVLTGDQHAHLKNALSLAQTALSHEPEQDMQPKKVIRAMNIRKASDGSHVIEHHHVDFSHPMEEHTAKNMDELHDHLEQHWGTPNDGEAESESEKDESPGVKAAEKAVGLEK